MVGICWGSIFLLKPKKLGNIMTYSLGDPMISWDGTPPRQGTLRNLVVTTISFMVVFNSIRQTTKQTLVNFRWWLMNMFFFKIQPDVMRICLVETGILKVNGFCIFFAINLHVRFAFFLWEIWCLEWICTSHLHFFAFLVFFLHAFWKRVEGFIFAFFQIGSVPRKRRAFFLLHFFLQICNFRAEPLGQAGKIQKTLGYVQKNAKMKKNAKQTKTVKIEQKQCFCLLFCDISQVLVFFLVFCKFF